MCVKLPPLHPPKKDSARPSETEITGWTWMLMSIAIRPWQLAPRTTNRGPASALGGRESSDIQALS